MKHHETLGGHVVASVLHAKPGERAAAVVDAEGCALGVVPSPATMAVYFGVVQAFF